MQNKKSNQSEGYSLVEMMVVVAILGILAGVGLTFYSLSDANEKVDKADVRMEIRRLQTYAITYYADHMTAPTTAELDAMQSRNGSTIIGKYTVIDPKSEAKTDLETINGYSPEMFVICSNMKLDSVNYLYAYDDKSPKEAAIGLNPTGASTCGSGISQTMSSQQDDSEDDETGESGDSEETGNTEDNEDDAPSGDDDTSPGGEVGGVDGESPQDECNIEQSCPCDGGWKNHGQYVNCVKAASDSCLEGGLINVEQKRDLNRSAAQSDCGKK